MDNNWIVDEIKDEIEIELNSMQGLNNLACNLQKEYKSYFETNDKLQVKNHEYWRTVELFTGKEINFFKSLLVKINDMEKEEVSHMEELYKNERDTRITSLGTI